MGLFTGLAIGAALGGGLLAGRKAASKKNQQQQTPPMAPGPGTAGGEMPAPPIVNPGADMAAAQAAGGRQRKRAAFGGAKSVLLPKPGQIAKTTPKRLIGY